MMRRPVITSSFVVYLGIASPVLALSQMKPCKKLNISKPACSYTTLNGNCTVTLDRLNPTTPPTIYARRGSTVTVMVQDTSPLEDLTLNLKGTTSTVPIDAFQAGFASIAGNAGKITVNSINTSRGLIAPDLASIIKLQSELKAALEAPKPFDEAKPALQLIAFAVQPPTGNVCFTTDAAALPFRDPADWKQKVTAGLDQALATLPDRQLASWKQALSDLSNNIQAASDPDNPTSDGITTVRANQQSLSNALSLLEQNKTKLQSLRTAVAAIADNGADTSAEIVDLQQNDRNYQTEVWTLDFSNKLLPVAKKLAATTTSSDSTNPLSTLTDAPVRTTVITLTVQYQSSLRFEVSSGLMVPLTPYHSYSAAEVATGGSPTGNVVQQTVTYTVVPAASVNVLIGNERAAQGQRMAFFGSVAVGYNPATTSVEFGVGPSLSWRSIVLSGLVDIGRDTQLAGGFTVGEPLPISNPPKPLTTTVWSIKPALALSVRLPLGGASK
jgi:hypothetical protein